MESSKSLYGYLFILILYFSEGFGFSTSEIGTNLLIASILVVGFQLTLVTFVSKPFLNLFVLDRYSTQSDIGYSVHNKYSETFS